MNLRPLLVPTIALLCQGCRVPVLLYPVNGPMQEGKPFTAIQGRVSGGFYSGAISFVLPEGEHCQGTWSSIKPLQVHTDNQAQDDSPSGTLFSVWSSIFGEGYYVANVLGARQHGQAILNGERGTVIKLEFYVSNHNGSPILGVARDNKGNNYKFVVGPM